VVAINRFSSDSDAEVACIQEAALAAGARAAVEANHWALGGAGAVGLGRALMEACAASRAQAGGPAFRYLYPLDAPIKAKIETVCREVYGAAGVTYSEEAERKIAAYAAAGYGNLPVCMAKTRVWGMS
jgi:formyltetrahydrofolate synthetase